MVVSMKYNTKTEKHSMSLDKYFFLGCIKQRCPPCVADK